MKYFFTCIITLLFIQLHAQYSEFYKRDSAFISASGTKILYLGDSIIPGVSLPFKSFIFKDVRADTSCIGRFSVECYLEKEGLYFPALRLETMVTSFDLQSSDYDILPEALNLLAIKASALNMEKCFKKKAYTSGEIESRYQQRFEKPVLTATELTKGVYMSFVEFLNNNPSIIEYEFLKDKKAAILYTKDNLGKFVPELNVFGFCDGRVIWLNIDNMFRPLIRQGKTFGFVATLNAHSDEKPAKKSTVNYVQMNTDLATASATAIATALSNTIDNLPYTSRSVVYQLDIESGDYY